MPTRKTRILPGGRCLICGCDLCAPVFDCPSCATPHHSACWQWTGGCAVYGCARRPRPDAGTERAAEISLVAAAAERHRVERPAVPSRGPSQLPSHAPFGVVDEPPAEPASAMTTAFMHLVLAVVLAAAGAAMESHREANAASRARVGRIQAIAPAHRTAQNQAMMGLSASELLADQVLRDDALWEGTGAEPVSMLRRMMVTEAGEGLRSGLRLLARRPLPDWLRARVQALQVAQLAGPPEQLALRRP